MQISLIFKTEEIKTLALNHLNSDISLFYGEATSNAPLSIVVDTDLGADKDTLLDVLEFELLSCGVPTGKYVIKSY